MDEAINEALLIIILLSLSLDAIFVGRLFAGRKIDSCLGKFIAR